MGSDVSPGSSLLQSKCELSHVACLIKAVGVYSPAARKLRQSLSASTDSSSIHTLMGFMLTLMQEKSLKKKQAGASVITCSP